jgi:hypothetical protein
MVLVISCTRTELRGIAIGLVKIIRKSTDVVRILWQPIIALLLATHQAALHP